VIYDYLSVGTDQKGNKRYWIHVFISGMDEMQFEIPASQLKEMQKKKRGSAGIPDEPIIPSFPPADPKPALDKPITSASGRVTNIDSVRTAVNKDDVKWEHLHSRDVLCLAPTTAPLHKKGSAPARQPPALEAAKATTTEVAAALAALPVEEGRRIAAAFLEASAPNHMKHLFNIIKRKNPGMSSLHDKIGLLKAVSTADEHGKDFDAAIAACIASLDPKITKDAEDPTKEKMLPLSKFFENALAVVRDAWAEIGGVK
jgi:hypothetical protein